MNYTQQSNLLDFLTAEQEQFERDLTAYCIFPVNVTKAAALSRAKALYKIERLLKFDGPFTKAYAMKSDNLFRQETGDDV